MLKVEGGRLNGCKARVGDVKVVKHPNRGACALNHLPYHHSLYIQVGGVSKTMHHHINANSEIAKPGGHNSDHVRADISPHLALHDECDVCSHHTRQTFRLYP